MGLPIVEEIWNGILWAIDFFVDKVPKPIKYIIFLMLILLFGFLMSFAFHLLGIHCNSGNQVYKASIMEIVTNVRIMMAANEDTVPANASFTEMYQFAQTTEELCSDYMRPTAEGCYEQCGNVTDPNCKFYWRQPSGYNCTAYEDFTICPLNLGLGTTAAVRPRCVSDVRPRATPWTLYERWFKIDTRCTIPNGYYYDYETNRFICEQASCASGLTEAVKINELLDSIDAQPMYTTSSVNMDYTRVISFACESYHPQLTLYGLRIFDYKIWLFTFVVVIMLIGLMKIKK